MTLSGTGLHGGRACELRFARTPGPTRLAAGDGEAAALLDLAIRRTDHGVSVALPDGAEIDLVEHLSAGIGALGFFAGLEARVLGGEVPLLDGGCAQIARALWAMEIPRCESPLIVARDFELSIGDARYELLRSNETAVSVAIDFPHPSIGHQEASWLGDPRDFLERIAPARTFGFVRDRDALRAKGRANAVDPRSVIVFDETGPAFGSELHSADEPARHKLLDLLGDLALHGGPARGVVRVSRPGHTGNHAFVRAALSAGALVRREVST